MKLWRLFHQLSTPKNFYRWSAKVLPWLTIAWIALMIYGLYGSLLKAPADYKQGDGFRIIYIHVPAAFLSLSIYLVMAINAIFCLIWRTKLAELVIKASAPIGASFAFIALVTGSIWGKPMWGTWWVWDARLTSELILLFLYLGVIALQKSLRGHPNIGRASAIVVIVGAVDIPIIHFSVVWWNTLHQGASLSLFSKPTIAASMLHPLLVMLAACSLFFIALLFQKLGNEILAKEFQSRWVRELLHVQS